MIKRFIDMPSGRFPKIKFKRGDEIHLSYFTSNTLKRLLQYNNFKIIEDTVDPYKPKMSKIDLMEYNIAKIIMKIFKINFYDTTLVIAKK